MPLKLLLELIELVQKVAPLGHPEIYGVFSYPGVFIRGRGLVLNQVVVVPAPAAVGGASAYCALFAVLVEGAPVVLGVEHLKGAILYFLCFVGGLRGLHPSLSARAVHDARHLVPRWSSRASESP
jgi:hypothetical protein